jgi:DnaJ family protein A protein 5
MSRFNSRVPFTDAPNGFYGILRETFANLAKEEDQATEWEGLEYVDYPDFGSAEDEYEDMVRPFYRVWINFTTKKTFSWRDQYKASDAPDRATRRLVDKENKRLRDEGIREFNDAVRSLVTFVRKRDPRYLPNTQSEADRQKILREAAAAQAARSRAANKAERDKHVVPEWAKSQEPAEEAQFSESEEEVVETIECVVCGKLFKSEKQYEAHERSKKHVKAVHELQREMRRENKKLNLDSVVDSGADTIASDLEELSIKEDDREGKENLTPEKDTDQETAGILPQVLPQSLTTEHETTPDALHTKDNLESESDEDDDYASRADVEKRVNDSLFEVTSTNHSIATASIASENENGAKIGKAKLKKAKKKAKLESPLQSKSSEVRMDAPIDQHISDIGH